MLDHIVVQVPLRKVKLAVCLFVRVFGWTDVTQQYPHGKSVRSSYVRLGEGTTALKFETVKEDFDEMVKRPYTVVLFVPLMWHALNKLRSFAEEKKTCITIKRGKNKYIVTLPDVVLVPLTLIEEQK